MLCRVGGLEWQRAQRVPESKQMPAGMQARMQQTTISAMFPRQPMQVMPMDF